MGQGDLRFGGDDRQAFFRVAPSFLFSTVPTLHQGAKCVVRMKPHGPKRRNEHLLTCCDVHSLMPVENERGQSPEILNGNGTIAAQLRDQRENDRISGVFQLPLSNLVAESLLNFPNEILFRDLHRKHRDNADGRTPAE